MFMAHLGCGVVSEQPLLRVQYIDELLLCTHALAFSFLL